MAWEVLVPKKNVTYISIGNNLTLCIHQLDGEFEARIEVLFIPAFNNNCDVVDSTTVETAEELAAFMTSYLSNKKAANHV